MARWTLPLLLAVTAGSARAVEPATARLDFSVLDSEKKPFLVGFFNVILDELVFKDGQVSLPKAITLTQNPFGSVPLVISPTASSSPPEGYITWSGTTPTASPLINSARFSIFSPQFSALAGTGSTWKSLGGSPASSFPLESPSLVSPLSGQRPPAAEIQVGPETYFRPGPLVLKFETIPTPPGSIEDPLTVPGPLPLLGAGVAFGFSRRLRRRIRS